MLTHLRPAFVLLLLLTVVTGLIYPLAITGVAQVAFPGQANGSLVSNNGVVIGSSLIGQTFAGESYFHGRPSAAGKGYDPTASSGSNLGPTSQALHDRVSADVDAMRAAGVTGPIPGDLLTTSASGLDPDISPESAALQIARVAKARRMDERKLHQLVADNTTGRQFGLLGEPRVNVLQLNLALDALGK